MFKIQTLNFKNQFFFFTNFNSYIFIVCYTKKFIEREVCSINKITRDVFTTPPIFFSYSGVAGKEKEYHYVTSKFK